MSIHSKARRFLKCIQILTFIAASNGVAHTQHKLHEFVSWPKFNARDAMFLHLSKTAPYSVAAFGSIMMPGSPPETYKWVDHLLLGSISKESPPTLIPACSQVKVDQNQLVSADFNGDGQMDFVWGRNLFLSAASGIYSCLDSGIDDYSRLKNLGTADLDGDGSPDLITYSVITDTISESTVSVRPYFFRGNHFDRGAIRESVIPIRPDFPGEPVRAKLDGNNGIWIAVEGYVNGGMKLVQRYQASLPLFDKDHDIGASRDTVVAGSIAAVSEQFFPPIQTLGRNGPVLFDVNGDGRPDMLSAFGYEWVKTALYISYGKSDNVSFQEPLPFVFSTVSAGDNDTFIDVADFDNNQCPDILLATEGGVTVLAGGGCR